MKLDFTKNLIYFPTPVLLKPKICMRAKLLTFLKLKNMKRLLRRRAQFIQYVNFAYIILERQNSFILPYRLTFYLKLIIKSIFLFLYKIHPHHKKYTWSIYWSFKFGVVFQKDYLYRGVFIL